MTELGWIFDPVPASGARSGGDASAFVFDATLDTFTREVLQNATDQHLAGDPVPVSVRFVLDPVSGERLDALRTALRWDALEAHVRGVVASAGPTERGRFARAVDADPAEILVLWIEDRHTTGLVGPEAGDGPFAALCRDRLFSDKREAGAGGSFGLGKAVLWRFSRWSTVAFGSRLGEDGRRRFVAKAALPWHEVGDRGFAGDGWLGREEPTEGGPRAVSVWDADADAALAGLGAAPLPHDTGGTSIGVVGFEEPATDDAPAPSALAERLRTAADRSFWPAVALGRLDLSVEVRGAPPIAAPSGGPWRAAYRRYLGGEEASALRDPGDVIVHPLALALPARRARGEVATTARVDLVVRRAAVGEPDPNELVGFRGPGMVVERRRLDRLSAGAIPFHALVVAGGARRDPSPSDDLVELFLRDAEPPSHDRWVSTPRLKQDWRRGYATAVEGLWRDAVDALRRLTAARVTDRDDGPVGLRRLFPVVGPGPAARDQAAFTFTALDASIGDDGRWTFSGAVAPTTMVAAPWSVRIDVRVPDGGEGVGALIDEIAAEPGAAAVTDGVATIAAPAGTDRVAFRGRTGLARFPVAPHRACLELVVTGRVTE
ncbi:MAG: hypothetical protein ABMB14_24585 [Myxococcota bacterium]